MNEPVSIITASYNYENLIKETIESVIGQTYKNWELIIVDDGSKDNSVDVIKSYCAKDERIKLYQHNNGENKGLAETIKLGLEKAQSDWVIFLESDDTIRPDYIEKKLEVIKNYPDIKFIYNDVNLFGDEDRIKEYGEYFEKFYTYTKNTTFPANITKDLGKLNLIPTFSCVMCRKEILKNLSLDCIYKDTLDWHLWSQIAYKYDVYYVDEKLTNWRIHKDSYINRGKRNKYKDAYFYKIQIKDNLTGGKQKLLNRISFILAILKSIRRSIISVRINKKEISLKLFNIKIFEKLL